MASRPLRIPDAELPLLEAFEADHPEERERIDEIRRRDREMCDFAEAVIGDIYDHYTTGAPTAWMLGVSLHRFAALLSDDSTDPGRREAHDRREFLAELDRLRTRLGVSRRESSQPRSLLAIADEPIDEKASLYMALTAIERTARKERQRARAGAFREAATLVQGSDERAELERRAAEAENAISTADDLAAEHRVESDGPEQ
jgi:hypothetical protein